MVAKALFSASAKHSSEPTAISVSGALMRSSKHQRDAGGDQSAGEIHQAGAQQIAHAFHVAHDARHQSAGFVGVVKGNRQAGDVRLHLLAQVRRSGAAPLSTATGSAKKK